MGHLLLKGLEALTVLAPFILVFAVFSRIDKQHNRQVSARHFWALGAFSIYIFAAIFFTGAGTIYGLLRYSSEIHSGDMINLLPFSHTINTVEYLENILLFMPLGFLLPFIWPKMDKFHYVLPFGLTFSLLIEISQMLGHRSTDVDDLLMNTAGTLLGFLLHRLFTRIVKYQPARLQYSKYEPLIYVGAMFFGHFLLYDGVGLSRIFAG